MSDTRYLAGHHAVVTGAGRGIGAAVAMELARLGANVTLMGRDQKRLDAQAEEVARAHKVETAGVKCDVGRPRRSEKRSRWRARPSAPRGCW